MQLPVPDAGSFHRTADIFLPRTPNTHGKDALMRKTHHKTAFADIPTGYAALVAMFPPRPIHDSVDYANTMEVVMAMAGHKLTRDQDDYLTILSQLILNYDREHDQPRKRGTPHQRLQYLVKEAGMKRAWTLADCWAIAGWDRSF